MTEEELKAVEVAWALSGERRTWVAWVRGSEVGIAGTPIAVHAYKLQRGSARVTSNPPLCGLDYASLKRYQPRVAWVDEVRDRGCLRCRRAAP